MTRSKLELGAYVLPGRVLDPLPGLAHAVEGERIGLGSIWVSERTETKEIAAVLGALSQITSRVKLVAGVTHFSTRHPIVTAGMAATLQALSGNRLVLGFGRGIGGLWQNLGIAPVVNAAMVDHASILRALWAGETVRYDGPAGRYPSMHMPARPAVPPPIILAAIGPKTLALAGQHFDGAILHPFLTPEGVARSTDIVRRAAETAGRDPASVKVYAEIVVAPDTTPEETAIIVRARAVTYFSLRENGTQLIKMNGWDLAPMEQLLADPRYAEIERQKLSHAEFRSRLLEASTILPDEWMSTGAASGTAAQCAARLHQYRDAGADELVLHGTTPDRLGGLVAAYGSAG